MWARSSDCEICESRRPAALSIAHVHQRVPVDLEVPTPVLGLLRLNGDDPQALEVVQMLPNELSPNLTSGVVR